jgi:2-aminoadipate transaminase
MAQLESVPLDGNGIDLQELEKTVNRFPDARLLYLTPCFHNPAGIMYTQDRKNRVMDLIRNRNIPILEDDAYGDLYFYPEDKAQLKPMKAMDPSGIDICYTGTFSKILGPGLRLGWMLVPEEIYRKAELCKQSFDACSPSFTQVIADAFVRSGAIYPYIERLRKEYMKRAMAMVNALNENMPSYVKFEEPRGGFYIWLELPEETDATLILKESVEKGVVIVVGKTFDPLAKRNNFIRLAYSNTTTENINRGIPLLAEAIKIVCEK